MKTTYRFNNKRISKKALTEKLGASEVEVLTKKAQEGFREDPLEQQDFWVGIGMLTVEFA